MLNFLTNADAKVAPYRLTTLEPHLAVRSGMILMDLPGLIEGTYEGKGLGTRFKRHTYYAKSIAHFLTLESEDIVDDYVRMRAELKNIDEGLGNKPEFIVLSKSDLATDEEVQRAKDDLKQFGKPVIVTSINKYQEVEEIIEFFQNQI